MSNGFTWLETVTVDGLSPTRIGTPGSIKDRDLLSKCVSYSQRDCSAKLEIGEIGEIGIDLKITDQ